MIDIKTRAARADDADFLAWLILTAGRAHVKKGIWEVILGMPEEQCLYFLKLLSVTKIHHLFHHACYLLADVNGSPVAGLGGYDPVNSGNSALWKALPEVFQEVGGASPNATMNGSPPRILNCIPESVKGSWVVDSVAAVHEFRRKGVVSKLLKEILLKGRQQGFKRAQINIYIGNVAAQRLYEKHGFKILDEIRDPYFEAQIGSPGMSRMILDL